MNFGDFSRLPVRRTPKDQESFKGFVLSLAHLNGLPSMKWVLTSAGLPARFATAPCDLAGLAALLGCSASILENLPAWPIPGVPGMVKFGLTAVHGLDIDLVHPKICPACVLEEKPIPRFWDLCAVAVCPIHRLVLLDHCFKCLKRLPWLRAEPAKCKCGADLWGAKTWCPAPHDALIFASWIVALILDTAPPSAAGPLGARIDHLDDLLLLIRFFGMETSPERTWRQTYLSKPSMTRALSTNAQAASVLIDWPRGLFDWLKARRSWKTGMEADLGPTLRRLSGTFKGPRFQFLADAVSEYLATEWEGGLVKTWARFYSAPAVARRVVGVTAASKLLSTSVDRVEALLERGELQGRCGKKRAPKLVETRSLAQIHADRQVAISSLQLAHGLNIHRKEIGRMRSCGFLKSSHRTRSGYMFPPHAGDELIKLLRRQAEGSGEMSDGICLSEIPYWRKVSLTAVLKMIEKQEVTLLVESVPGSRSLSHLKVSKAEVLRLASANGSTPMLTVREAAEKLGVAIRMIPILVQTGCLDGNVDDAGRLQKRGVSAASVQRFPENYVLASSIAKAEQTSTAAITRRLKAANILPVVESDGSRGISAVWRRVDVASVPGRTK